MADIDALTSNLGGLQLGPGCSANLNGQLQVCGNTNCPVLNYNDINIHLCSSHETYMQGSIFRSRFPGFDLTAFLMDVQSATDAREDAPDIQLFDATVLYGHELDDLTADLHPNIKASIIKYIEDYFFFLENSTENDALDALMESDSQFATRYRQQVVNNGVVNSELLRRFKNECRGSGCVFVLEYDPSPEAIEMMDDEGQEAVEDALAVMVGFTTNLQSRLSYLKKCPTNQSYLRTFPATLRHARKCLRPAVFVELLAGIVHEILVPYQHDIWCPCKTPNGRTHTQIYWFQGLEPAAPFYRLMDTLEPRIQQWVDAFELIKNRVPGHLYDP
ncbi:hypothetical protein BGX23_003472 [Mortierella sp. AD031]|nr:hypothetical protein BGX23_003472 [Mortierella sp. AD031]